MPRAGIGRNIGQAQLLPGTRPLAGLAHVLGEADFAGRQEQQAPGRGRFRQAVPARPVLAGTVREHVGDFSRLARLYLRQFVQDQR